MKFFYSPQELIGLIKNRNSLPTVKETHAADWYFTKSGEEAYNDAKTPAQKTMYFFEYLWEVVDSPNDIKDAIYRLAYVMANSIDSSSLEFAGYPNILDATKNPLVNCIKSKKFSNKKMVEKGIQLMLGLDDEASAHTDDNSKYVDLPDSVYICLTYCVLLLAALNGEEDVEKYFTALTRGSLYTLLSQPGTDGSFSDKYRVERDIIGAFCSSVDGKYMVPYFRLLDSSSLADNQNI